MGHWKGEPGLSEGLASRFAGLVLGCARREYPNKLDHVMGGAQEARSPRELHPSFYGCFDWHSAVHGHWMLARVLRVFPHLAQAGEIRRLMEETLAPERVEGEVAYFQRKEGRGFERTYGWAWLLKLAAELETWDGPEGGRWARQLQPLTEEVVGRFRAFLPVQAYPIRSGVHANTAFSLSLALDYGREALNEGFETLLMERARTYFIRDRSGALGWEPGGEDFLSPCLEEAALMAKVLAPEAFGPWLEAFLPEPAGLEPARVADRTDPRIVHLDGLNLSRARALGELAAALEPGDRRRAALEDCALRHARTSLPQVLSGHYEGEHWLATFAVGLLAPGGRVGGHSLM